MKLPLPIQGDSGSSEDEEGLFKLSVSIPCGHQMLSGDLTVPARPKGIIIFAHGSGSSRQSPRNRYVSRTLNEGGFATLLMDLLTEDEERADARSHHLRFDILLLSERLKAATAWVRNTDLTIHFPIAYFGASTGAAAAMIAAARDAHDVKAIVSRGGRADLAMQFLPFVKAPVLLIVGEHDPEVLKLNKKALAALNEQSRLDVVPRATHLFEEPGALEAVGQIATGWFAKHVG